MPEEIQVYVLSKTFYTNTYELCIPFIVFGIIHNYINLFFMVDKTERGQQTTITNTTTAVLFVSLLDLTMIPPTYDSLKIL